MKKEIKFKSVDSIFEWVKDNIPEKKEDFNYWNGIVKALKLRLLYLKEVKDYQLLIDELSKIQIKCQKIYTENLEE